jgi:hypothetical protein
VDTKAAWNDQIALRTPVGRTAASWCSAAVFGTLVAGVVGGLMDFGPTEAVPAAPTLVGGLGAFIYAKTVRTSLIGALGMCAFALLYIGYIIVVPPATWGVRYPIAHYITGAICVLFALQGLRGAFAERRARQTASAT